MKLACVFVTGWMVAVAALGMAHAEEPVAFRVNSVELVDPHVFAGALFLCFDSTDQVNDEMVSELNGDEEDDGLLDVSLALVFRPMDQVAASSPMEVHVADCSAPASSTECTPGDVAVASAAEHDPDVDTCLAPDEEVLGPYGDPTEPSQPCFSSPEETINITVAGVNINIEAARVSATYKGDPTTKLVDGLLIGFLRESVAEKTFIPDDIPFVGGNSLASLFRGGDDCCESGDDRDLGPNGESGWWLHFNFSAERVAWSD